MKLGNMDLAFFDKIRTRKKTHTVKQQILITMGVLLFGFCLGTFSKYLEYQPKALPLPYLLDVIDSTLDFHNFLSTLTPWLFIAVCTAIYSHTPVRAAINVFVFFAGMVSGYYLYCNFVAGFFPKSYAMIWIGLTILSPFLAFICWYAKGKGAAALVISAGILSFFINCAFSFRGFYIFVSPYWLDMIIFLAGLFILRRPVKEMAVMIGVGIVFAVVFESVIPFGI